MEVGWGAAYALRSAHRKGQLGLIGGPSAIIAGAILIGGGTQLYFHDAIIQTAGVMVALGALVALGTSLLWLPAWCRLANGGRFEAGMEQTSRDVGEIAHRIARTATVMLTLGGVIAALGGAMMMHAFTLRSEAEAAGAELGSAAFTQYVGLPLFVLTTLAMFTGAWALGRVGDEVDAVAAQGA